MRILVTGHKGYIGSVMVPMLVDAGHEVVGVDTDLFRDCATAPPTQQVPELELDIRDAELGHLEGFEAVVHLAALSKDPLSDLLPEVTDEINHVASVGSLSWRNEPEYSASFSLLPAVSMGRQASTWWMRTFRVGAGHTVQYFEGSRRTRGTDNCRRQL